MIERLLKGFSLSTAILLVTVVVQVVAVPVYLHAWGSGIYGEWIALTSLAATVSVLNLGVHSYTGNRMIEAFATGDVDKGTLALQQALRLYSVLCVMALVVVIVLALWPATLAWLRVEEMPTASARTILFLFGVMAIYSLMCGMLLGILRAIKQHPRQLAYGLAERVFALCSPLVIAALGGAPLAAAAGVTVLMLIWGLIVLRDVGHRSPFVIGVGRSSWGGAFRLLGPSLAFFGVGMASTVLATGIILLLSSGAGPQAVAVFSVTLMLPNIVRLLCQLVLNVLSPEITSAAHRPLERPALVSWHRLCVKGAVTLVAVAAVCLWVLGADVLLIWTGGRIGVEQGLILLLAVHLAIQAPSLVSTTFGLALNQQRPLFAANAVTTVIALLAAWMTIPSMSGASGAALGLVLGQVVATVWIAVLACGWVGDTLAGFAKDVLGRGILSLPVAPLLAVGMAEFASSLAARTAVALLATAAGLATFWIFWLTPVERAQLAGVAARMRLGLQRKG